MDGQQVMRWTFSLSFSDDFSIRFIELRDARIGRPGAEEGRDKEEQTVRLRLTKFRPPSAPGGPGLPSQNREGDCYMYL